MIPAFIINRNLCTWPKAMYSWLQRAGCNPIIIDNDSTYQPTLEWYTSVNVHYMGMNAGHMCPWGCQIVKNYLAQHPSEFYIVADPDFELPESEVHTTIPKMIDCLQRHPHLNKIALAIKIDDIPEDCPVKCHIPAWEGHMWSLPISDENNELFDAPADTTFALYKSSDLQDHGYTHKNHLLAYRLGGPYTARHLPWYITQETIYDEFCYYLEHASETSTVSQYYQNLVAKFRGRQ